MRIEPLASEHTRALYDAIVYKLHRDGAPAGVIQAAE